MDDVEVMLDDIVPDLSGCLLVNPETLVLGDLLGEVLLNIFIYLWFIFILFFREILAKYIRLKCNERTPLLMWLSKN